MLEGAKRVRCAAIFSNRVDLVYGRNLGVFCRLCLPLGVFGLRFLS